MTATLPDASAPASDRLLVPPRDAARMLAVSPRTLWTLTARGDVPCVRCGRLVRYSPTDLAKWIDRQRSTGPRS
jgi:excisionase family DNA binding protein